MNAILFKLGKAQSGYVWKLYMILIDMYFIKSQSTWMWMWVFRKGACTFFELFVQDKYFHLKSETNKCLKCAFTIQNNWPEQEKWLFAELDLLTFEHHKALIVLCFCS